MKDSVVENEPIPKNVEDDDLDEEEGDSGGSSSGGKKKLLIIVGAVFLLLIGGGAAAYFTGLLDPLLGGSEKTVSGSEPVADGEALFFDLDDVHRVHSLYLQIYFFEFVRLDSEFLQVP